MFHVEHYEKVPFSKMLPRNIFIELAELAVILKFDKNQKIFGEGEKTLCSSFIKGKNCFFEKQKFLNLIQRKPEIALNLLALFSLKLKTLVKQI